MTDTTSGVPVRGGRFGRQTTGLMGKFDNVRRKWENELLRSALKPIISGLVERKRRSLQRLRVMDLGCARGEAFELLTVSGLQASRRRPGEGCLIEPDMLSFFAGIDINNELVREGNELFKQTGKVQLRQGDLREGLTFESSEPPYDLFVSTYGSASQLTDPQLENVLAAVAKHSRNAVVVLDLMGRFSYEWPARWGESGQDELNMEDYTVSYRGDDWGESSERPERFPMRFWSRPDVEALVAGAARKASAKMAATLFADRSLFVGRHMDTQEYNTYVQPTRRAVNMLLEPDVQTDLDSLLIDYVPTPGFEDQNKFYEKLQVAWNAIIKYAREKTEQGSAMSLSADLEDMAEPVAKAIKHIDSTIESVGWMSPGEARANIVEPQLAYALRNLEADFQAGEGMGHFLLCVVEVGG